MNFIIDNNNNASTYQGYITMKKKVNSISLATAQPVNPLSSFLRPSTCILVPQILSLQCNL